MKGASPGKQRNSANMATGWAHPHSPSVTTSPLLKRTVWDVKRHAEIGKESGYVGNEVKVLGKAKVKATDRLLCSPLPLSSCPDNSLSSLCYLGAFNFIPASHLHFFPTSTPMLASVPQPVHFPGLCAHPRLPNPASGLCIHAELLPLASSLNFFPGLDHYPGLPPLSPPQPLLSTLSPTSTPAPGSSFHFAPSLNLHPDPSLHFFPASTPASSLPPPFSGPNPTPPCPLFASTKPTLLWLPRRVPAPLCHEKNKRYSANVVTAKRLAVQSMVLKRIIQKGLDWPISWPRSQDSRASPTARVQRWQSHPTSTSASLLRQEPGLRQLPFPSTGAWAESLPQPNGAVRALFTQRSNRALRTPDPVCASLDVMLKGTTRISHRTKISTRVDTRYRSLQFPLPQTRTAPAQLEIPRSVQSHPAWNDPINW